MNRPTSVPAGSLLIVCALAAISGCGGDSGPIGPSGGGDLHHPAGTIVMADTIGAEPFGVGISPSGSVYVTQLDIRQLSLFDLSGRRFSSANVGQTPTDVVFSPDGASAYDTDQEGARITKVTVASNTPATHFALAANPYRIRLRDDRLYVTAADARVRVLSAATGAVIDSILVGGTPNGIALAPDGGHLFVSSFDGAVVKIIALPADTVVRTLAVGGAPQDIAISPDGSWLFVANAAGGVQEWDTADSLLVTTIPVGNGSETFGLAVSRDGKQVWVSAPDLQRVYIIDTATQGVVDSIQTGGVPRRIAFSSDGAVAVITNQNGWVDFVQ